MFILCGVLSGTNDSPAMPRIRVLGTVRNRKPSTPALLSVPRKSPNQRPRHISCHNSICLNLTSLLDPLFCGSRGLGWCVTAPALGPIVLRVQGESTILDMAGEARGDALNPKQSESTAASNSDLDQWCIDLDLVECCKCMPLPFVCCGCASSPCC